MLLLILERHKWAHLTVLVSLMVMMTFSHPRPLENNEMWDQHQADFVYFSDAALLNSNDSHYSLGFVYEDVCSKSCLQTSAGN